MGVTTIGKPTGENVLSLNSETWNIADGFTKIKILRLLIELDLYEAMSRYGYKEVDDPNYSADRVADRRVEGLDRMLFTLKQLIGNCKFSIRDKGDKQILNFFFERINNVEQVINGVARICKNDVTKEEELSVNEEHFNTCFDILREIKDELNIILNKAGLIFRQSDEVDLDKIMRDISEGA
jgi:hypothetical protein